MTSRRQLAPDVLDANQASRKVRTSKTNGNSAPRCAHERLPHSGVPIRVRQSTSAVRNHKHASLEYQREQLKELASQYGVPGEFFESHRDGESVHASDRQAGFEKLLSEIESGRVKLVVVPFPHRLTRAPMALRLPRGLTFVDSSIVDREPYDCSSRAATRGLAT
jgi:hypothetical protein